MTGTPSGHHESALIAGLRRQLDARIDEVARRLLGDPNRALSSSRSQLRFGRNGSVAVELVGAKRGQWYDHKNKLGGGALDLVSRCTGLSGRAAAEWTATEFGIAAEKPSRPEHKRIIATYDYRDENGVLLFQVVRYAPKTFRHRRMAAAGAGGSRASAKSPTGCRSCSLPTMRRCSSSRARRTLTGWPASVWSLDARRRVASAIDALGGPAGGCVGHVVGLQCSIREWSMRQGLGWQADR